jgi:hypothetical protein
MYKSIGMYKLRRYVWWGGEGVAMEGPLVAGASHSGLAKRNLLAWEWTEWSGHTTN